MLQNDINKAYQTALNLERTVIEDAKKKAEKIISEAKLAEKTAISEIQDKARRESDQFEQTGCAAIRAKYSNILTEHISNCRTQLIKKRNQIQNAVFEKLEQKLRDFTASDDYADFAKSSLLRLKNKQLSDSIKILVSAVAADEIAARSCFPNAEITVSNSIVLGGFIVQDMENNIMYDVTLDSSFDLKKSDFPEISGLKISD